MERVKVAATPGRGVVSGKLTCNLRRRLFLAFFPTAEKRRETRTIAADTEVGSAQSKFSRNTMQPGYCIDHSEPLRLLCGISFLIAIKTSGFPRPAISFHRP